MSDDYELSDGYEFVDGSIRHEELPDDLLGAIKAVYEQVGHYLDSTLEAFEIPFMRDVDPGREVVCWIRIANCWRQYHHEHNNAIGTREQERKIIGKLIAISSGVRDVKLLGRDKYQSDRLIECWDDSGLIEVPDWVRASMSRPA